MKRIISLILSSALALGLLSGCGSGTSSAPPADASPSESGSQSEQGNAAALGSLSTFSSDTLDGGIFTQDDVKAKDITVVNFWSTTCGPCIVEMPDLAEFAKALPDNVQLVTVCLDGYGNEDAVREIVQQAGFEEPVLLTGSDDLLELSRNLIYTPTTVLADSDGKLVGDAIIGAKKDLPAVYLEAVNQALAAGGKDEISLETD